MASRTTPGPKKKPETSDPARTPPPKPSGIEDLGDLTNLGEVESMTISALVEAVAGANDAPADDDDDALGLGSVGAPSSGPPSGILRPSALPDDDALSLDMLPANPGNEASLSFVARSDMNRGDSEIGDVIATGSVKPSGKTPAWFAPPKSGKLRPSDGPLSGKFKSADPPSGSRLITGGEAVPERSDIFSGSAPTGSSLPRGGDSNLLSVMAGTAGESSNILSNLDAARGPSSDLFGDSRIIADSNPDMPRPTSDILAGSRVSSDILAGSQNAANSSDILAGSSLFDDPGKTTDKLSGSKSVASPDSFVPLFDEGGEGSSIVLNRPSGKGLSSSPDPIDDDPGLISFDIPKKVKKPNSSGGDAIDPPEDTDDDRTSFMAIPEDEDDALAAEFLGGGVDRSGVNLLGQFDHQETMSEGDEEDSSDDVFNARTMMDIDIEAGSGLNLLTPGSEKLPRAPGPGPKSESIFSGPPSGKIDVQSGGSEVVSRSGPNSPASIFGPETGGGPSSAIFPVGKKKAGGSKSGGQVSFDMPNKAGADQTDKMQASGLIDWSKGASDSDQLSLRTQATDQMSQPEEMRKKGGQDTDRSAQPFELEESDSVFDVQLPEDASTESQLFKAEQYARAAAAGAAVAESGIIAGRSGKIPKVEPVSSRTKFIPPPPAKRSKLGWLGGTAAGLLAGVGLTSAAVVGGLIPGKASPTAEIAAVRDDYESKIQRLNADLNSAVESTKQQAVKEAQDAFRKTEAELQAKLMTAASTARVANQAKDDAEKKLDQARKDAIAANGKVDEARNEVAAASKARDEAMTELAGAKAALAEKSSAAATANERLKSAEANVKRTTETLVAAVKDLQAANLIDPKADPAKAFSQLPDAIKKAAAGGSTPDGKKLQELTGQLIAAKKDADTAKAAATAEKAKADALVATAKAEVAKATEKLAAELATAKAGTAAEIEKAMAKAQANFQTQLAATAAEVKREQDDRKADATRYEAKLAAQAEEFRQQIAAARAGVMVAQTDAERGANEKAARLFGVGTDAYFEGRYQEAITALTAATKANPSDARSWYYLGLSQWMSGDRTAAAVSYQTAAQWEARNVTAARQVGPALERVQGPARTFLETFRP